MSPELCRALVPCPFEMWLLKMSDYFNDPLERTQAVCILLRRGALFTLYVHRDIQNRMDSSTHECKAQLVGFLP